MKFLKKSQINFRNVKDNSIAIQITGEVTLDTPNVLLLPKGTENEKPGLNGLNSPTVGHIRYNTTTNEVEVYQGVGGRAAWRSLRYKESTNIVQQDLGAGDEIEIYFGPLNPAPPEPNFVDDKTTWGGQNLLVMVENVIQIHGVNYTIKQNPCLITSNVISFDNNTITSNNVGVVDFVSIGYYSGQEIVVTGSNLNNKTYTIASLTQTTIVVEESVPGTSELVTEGQGTNVTIAGKSSATGPQAGAIYQQGYYVKFDSPVPIGTVDPKKVIILHGFDR